MVVKQQKNKKQQKKINQLVMPLVLCKITVHLLRSHTYLNTGTGLSHQQLYLSANKQPTKKKNKNASIFN